MVERTSEKGGRNSMEKIMFLGGGGNSLGYEALVNKELEKGWKVKILSANGLVLVLEKY